MHIMALQECPAFIAEPQDSIDIMTVIWQNSQGQLFTSQFVLVAYYPTGCQLEYHVYHTPAQIMYNLGISTVLCTKSSHYSNKSTQPCLFLYFPSLTLPDFHGLGPSRSHLLATTLTVTRRHKLECPTRSIFILILEYSMRVPEQVQRQPLLLEPNLVLHQLSELPSPRFWVTTPYPCPA